RGRGQAVGLCQGGEHLLVLPGQLQKPALQPAKLPQKLPDLPLPAGVFLLSHRQVRHHLPQGAPQSSPQGGGPSSPRPPGAGGHGIQKFFYSHHRLSFFFGSASLPRTAAAASDPALTAVMAAPARRPSGS